MGNQTKKLFQKKGSTTQDSELKQGRVRLSCDIRREQHRLLRLEAARTDRTILQVIESMIEENLGTK